MKKVKLGDVCKIQSGGTPSRGNLNYWNNGNIPWVKISDIKEKYLSRTEEFITQEGLANSSAKIFPKETILYTIFATLGEVSILEIEATTNQAIAGLQIIDENICKDYLYYYLISLKPFVNEIGRGVAQNNINMQILRNFEIPLPSLEEQKAIARKLDKVSGLIEKRKTQHAKLSELVKSRFIEMFGDCKESRKLEEYAVLITKGASPKWQGFDYCDEGVLFVTSENVREGFLDLSKRKYLPQGINDILPRSVLKKNDILINIVNASIGRAAIYDSDELANINQAVALVRLKPNVLNLSFLLTYLNSDEACASYDFMKVGGDKANLSLKNISDLKIPVASMERQLEFESFKKQVDKSKFEIQQSLEKLEILKKSLMQQYFG